MKRIELFALLIFVAVPLLSAQQDVSAPTITDASAEAGGAEPFLNLESTLREALEKNPEAESALHTVNAIRQRVPQATALPDPMVSVGWAGNAVPFSIMRGDPSSYRGLTVSEQFPYPGKRKLRGAMVSKEAEAAETDYEAIKRRVAAEVKAAYYDYFYFDKAIETTNRNKQMLEKLTKIAETRYSVGSAMQQDVLRSQLEVAMLIEKLTMLEQQKATAQARINVYLMRAPDAPLAPVENVEATNLQYSLDEMNAFAAVNDTTAQRNQKMIERGQLGVALMKRDSRPDFGVSYMFQQRADQPSMNGLTFSVNIPIFYKTKQRAEVAEATEMVISAEKMQESRKHEIHFELHEQYVAAKSAERLITLYSKGIVPQASLALESSISSYQVGKLDFLSLITNFSTLLNYETDYYRQVADHEKAIAQMEMLTGVSLTQTSTRTLAMPASAQKEK